MMNNSSPWPIDLYELARVSADQDRAGTFVALTLCGKITGLRS